MIPSPMPLKRLEKIVRRLRSKRGCPWDQRQTHASLKSSLIEETYEVLDAIDRKDANALKEELGDLLLQIVFHAEIARSRDRFDMDDVMSAVCDKLIRRHPHVFARGRKVSAEGALKQWELLKREEKAGRSPLASVPPALPALMRAIRIQNKAARLGFEWRRFSQAYAKVDEELGELRTAIRRRRRAEIRRELGDTLFALAKAAKFLGIDPEDALQAANARFIGRFHALERAVARSGRDMGSVRPEELYVMWRKTGR
jgi:tetrapyrrole methylase family protein/MazG family protein